VPAIMKEEEVVHVGGKAGEAEREEEGGRGGVAGERGQVVATEAPQRLIRWMRQAGVDRGGPVYGRSIMMDEEAMLLVKAVLEEEEKEEGADKVKNPAIIVLLSLRMAPAASLFFLCYVFCISFFITSQHSYLLFQSSMDG